MIRNLQYIIIYGSFALTIVFLLLLCLYVNPIGVHEWDWITNLGGLHENLTIWQEQSYYYNNIMGRYSSTFISSLTDYWFNHSFFKFHFAFTLFLLVFSLFIVFKKLFCLNQKLTYLMLALFVLGWFGGVSDVFDTIFMMSSVHTYLYGFIIFILLIYVLNSLNHSLQISREILLHIITFIAIGFNEISAVYTILIWVILVITRIESPRLKNMILRVLVTGIIAFLFSYLAPGNFKRFDSQFQGYSFFELILLSVSTTVYSLLQWIVNGSLIILTLIAINFFPIEKFNKNNIVFNLFSIPSLLIVIFSGHFIFIFASKGTAMPERVIDLIYLYFLFFIFGFIARFSFFLKNYVKFSNWSILLLIVIFSLNYFFIGLSIERRKDVDLSILERVKLNSNIGLIAKSFLLNEPQSYNKNYFKSIEIIKKCRTDTCCISRPELLPKSIYNKMHDRKFRQGGEPFMGYYFNQSIKIIKYCD